MKIFAKLALLMVLMSSFSVCNAEKLGNKSDYVFLYINQGISTYMSKPSVKVHLYDPPNYELEGTYYHVMDESNEICRTYNTLFMYNYDTKEVWIYHKDTDKWNPVYPYNPSKFYNFVNTSFNFG